MPLPRLNLAVKPYVLNKALHGGECFGWYETCMNDSNRYLTAIWTNGLTMIEEV